MARVLVYTAPGSGHAYPPVATAIALRDRGHEVMVRTASGSVEALERLGLSAAPIDPRIEAIPLEDWKAHTSIAALMSACQTFGRHMLERGYGRIVNIASLSSFVALFEVAAYGASKAAVVPASPLRRVSLRAFGTPV